MSSITKPPQQHKQPSRKGKRAWRKNVDISEVQEGLETLRNEIIEGGPLAEKPSEELFQLDTTGSNEIKIKYNLQKTLKVDQILSQRSAVPAVDSRKRTSSRISDGVVELPLKRQKKDWVSKKEIQRIRNHVNDTSQPFQKALEELEQPDFDLWAPSPLASTTKSQDDYVPKPRAKVAPQTIRRAPIAMTVSGKPVRAVRKPDAGTSYNPTFEDWDDLLNREGEKELAAEKARIAAEEAEAERQARIDIAGAESDSGLREDETDWEGFETENEDQETLKRKRPGRMTPAQRNKAKRRKEAERLVKHEKAMGNKHKQAEQMIDAMLKRASEATDLVVAEEEEASDSGDDTALRRKRLGNTIIPEKSLEVVLPDELQESLRRLKPEGNLLGDRYRHLLVNGKIESRKPIIQAKKKKVKVTEKWSYKDFRIQV